MTDGSQIRVGTSEELEELLVREIASGLGDAIPGTGAKPVPELVGTHWVIATRHGAYSIARADVEEIVRDSAVRSIGGEGLSLDFDTVSDEIGGFVIDGRLSLGLL